MSEERKHPIENIKWTPTEELQSNDYNPNTVLTAEMDLLAFSLMKQGWIQPILASSQKEEGGYPIIDGYHRWWLTGNHDGVRAMTGGKVPVAFLDLTRAERIALTVRINRAKGVHAALKMHELVLELHEEHEWTMKKIGEEIGADRDEVNLLLADGVFGKKKIHLHAYSPAWESNISAGGFLEPHLDRMGQDPEKMDMPEIRKRQKESQKK